MVSSTPVSVFACRDAVLELVDASDTTFLPDRVVDATWSPARQVLACVFASGSGAFYRDTGELIGDMAAQTTPVVETAAPGASPGLPLLAPRPLRTHFQCGAWDPATQQYAAVTRDGRVVLTDALHEPPFYTVPPPPPPTLLPPSPDDRVDGVQWLPFHRDAAAHATPDGDAWLVVRWQSGAIDVYANAMFFLMRRHVPAPPAGCILERANGALLVLARDGALYRVALPAAVSTMPCAEVAQQLDRVAEGFRVMRHALSEIDGAVMRSRPHVRVVRGPPPDDEDACLMHDWLDLYMTGFASPALSAHLQDALQPATLTRHARAIQDLFVQLGATVALGYEAGVDLALAGSATLASLLATVRASDGSIRMHAEAAALAQVMQRLRSDTSALIETLQEDGAAWSLFLGWIDALLNNRHDAEAALDKPRPVRLQDVEVHPFLEYTRSSVDAVWGRLFPEHSALGLAMTTEIQRLCETTREALACLSRLYAGLAPAGDDESGGSSSICLAPAPAWQREHGSSSAMRAVAWARPHPSGTPCPLLVEVLPPPASRDSTGDDAAPPWHLVVYASPQPGERDTLIKTLHGGVPASVQPRGRRVRLLLNIEGHDTYGIAHVRWVVPIDPGGLVVVCEAYHPSAPEENLQVMAYGRLPAIADFADISLSDVDTPPDVCVLHSWHTSQDPQDAPTHVVVKTTPGQEMVAIVTSHTQLQTFVVEARSDEDLDDEVDEAEGDAYPLDEDATASPP
ncbi:hypothetical protein CXG81DRAFT_16901 [Caulochytrium protostelioides]|uniref:Anaphase-promoting complex subunit 4 n=1 Tax=Caulochytrium protostelioides TaxID=1555241 RepID=A0A4V1IVB9_9FUNG|nr:hypothetical protein CXG81DRAFT_16901 [Caulochytrium protostelioides]|eukprot:RKP03519.1 hypothetical protein CXG81DRAFT_16901 [Caulochytrium protostelioides]